MVPIMTKPVKGHDVVWANNGRVYISRDLHDKLPVHMQGVSFMCKTPGEFERICAQMSA